MRYIKERNKEPKELTIYRTTTPNASYDGFVGKSAVRQSLAEEQGYICAYCMGKIDEGNCTIEHYISQSRHDLSPYPEEKHKELSLCYSNMCGVCRNNGEHCDKSRGNIPLEVLDPHNPSCETLITYNLNGEIIPSGIENEKVQHDIETLKLSCYKLNKMRKASWEEVWNRFKQNHDKDTWSKELFLEQAEYYRSRHLKRGKNKFHAYCNYIIWNFCYYAENYKKK